jgi:ParB family chromosome partitioning protein
METKTDSRLKRAGEIFLVPFEQIVIDDSVNNDRVDFGNIDELADSIEESGLRIPLFVKKVRGEEKYILIQGKRRYFAIKKLIEERGADFQGVKCFLALPNYSVEDSLFDQITMNDGKPYSNLEQGAVFAKLVQKGYTVSDIARKIAKSVTHIANCMEIAALPKKVRDLVAAGSVSGLTAVELSKVVKTDEELVEKLEAAVETAPVTTDGKKKKVTKKDVKEVAITSTIKKMEEVKRLLTETEGVNLELVQFFNKLVSRLKAGESVESLLELFTK